jgi:hypothetical protein
MLLFQQSYYKNKIFFQKSLLGVINKLDMVLIRKSETIGEGEELAENISPFIIKEEKLHCTSFRSQL